MKKITMLLDEFIKQLQIIQADMASVKSHPYSNSISFYLHTKDDGFNLELCEDKYDTAIEYDYHMGCRCTLGANINLTKKDDNNHPSS